jgi:hypothetical protein
MLDAEAVPRSSARMSVGSDFNDSEYYGVQTSIALKEAQIYLAANRQSYEIESSSSSFGIGSSPLSRYSVYVEASQSEIANSLSTRDILVELSFNPDYRYFTLGYQPGEIEIISATLLPGDIERSAWHIGMGISGELFYGYLDHWQFYYNRRDRLIIFEDSILKQILKKRILALVRTLAEQETGIELGFQGTRYEIAFIYNRVTSVVDDEVSDYVAVTLSRKLNRTLSLSLLVDKPVEDGEVSMGIAVDWRW